MIAFLEGLIHHKNPTEIVMNVGGVGYKVFISLTTYEQLPKVGEKSLIHTHFSVREDAQTLYGFYELSEYDMFTRLLSVTGIGPKVAITILSGIKASELTEHIANGNTRLLTTIPGVGKKMAERIIVELKDKLTKLRAGQDGIQAGTYAYSQDQEDAISALIALGFSRIQAEKSVATITRQSDEPLRTDEIIRLALRQD